MGATTGIEWTDATWNPIRGCSRVSEGCRNCYAESVAARFAGAGQAYEGLAEFKITGVGLAKKRDPRWTGKIAFVETHLEDPLRWKKPRRIFVNSMSDLFHEGVHDDWLIQIFAVMQACPQHTFQILTKRPMRMLSWMTEANGDLVSLAGAELAGQKGWCHAHEDGPWPLENVWMGVSVEDQTSADARLPLLLKTPAAVRWVSYEPALGPIDWAKALGSEAEAVALDWIVCGGESGHEARPMHPDWARATRAICQKAGIPFFFKQWGEWSPIGPVNARQGAVNNYGKTVEPIRLDQFPQTWGESWQAMYRVGKHDAGAQLDGIEWREYPKC